MTTSRFVALCFALSTAAGCYKPDIMNGGFTCVETDNPACPRGFVCQKGYCIDPTSNSPGPDMAVALIPKTQVYSGNHVDPGLETAGSCPDHDLEPNDSPEKATPPPFSIDPNAPPATATNLAICPKGVNPMAGGHDIDYYKIDTSNLPQTQLTVVATINYQIVFGDLDIAIFNKDGTLLAADASIVDNGCVAATLTPDVYYIAVVGAYNQDVNNYTMKVRTYTGPQSCPNGPQVPMDMSVTD